MRYIQHPLFKHLPKHYIIGNHMQTFTALLASFILKRSQECVPSHVLRIRGWGMCEGCRDSMLKEAEEHLKNYFDEVKRLEGEGD